MALASASALDDRSHATVLKVVASPVWARSRERASKGLAPPELGYCLLICV